MIQIINVEVKSNIEEENNTIITSDSSEGCVLSAKYTQQERGRGDGSSIGYLFYGGLNNPFRIM